MTVIFPIGGIGSRFITAGYPIPKPFLPVGDTNLIELAINSYPEDSRFIFIPRLEFADRLKELLASTNLNYKVMSINYDTSGPIKTILAYVDLIVNDWEVMVADCDSFINAREIEQAVDYFRSKSADGGVTVRKTTDPNCSYAKIVGDTVIETREKDVISDWSTTGPYWFRSGRILVNAMKQASSFGITSISPVYNCMIKDGARVISYMVNTFTHLGTPEEYESYCQRFSL